MLISSPVFFFDCEIAYYKLLHKNKIKKIQKTKNKNKKDLTRDDVLADVVLLFVAGSEQPPIGCTAIYFFFCILF